MEDRIRLLGVDIHSVTLAESLAVIERLVNASGQSLVFTPNVQRLVSASCDKRIKNIYAGADLIVPDGLPLVWASKILGTPLKERVTGADLFPLLCGIAARRGYRVFLLGGAPGVADMAARTLKRQNPGLLIAGTYCPPYHFEKNAGEVEKALSFVDRSRPDLLFVSLGFPKEELFLSQHRRRLAAGVSLGVGASFAYAAGTLKRAPRWMQSRGLEWFFRFCQEPGRLWNRYAVGNSIFLWLVLKELLKKS
jgi:N-acetylglucosaminyldiphosphoundecaprenol N-acetyl-beta-D-mannosaminyltransferase